MIARLTGLLRREGAGAGIALMLLGILLFMLNDTLGKWLVADYAVGQLLLLRSVAALLVLLPMIRRAGGLSILRVERPMLHLLRVALIVCEVAAFYWSVRYLPLADVTTFYMAAPLFVTAMSVPFLGERVGPRRWSAVLVGFGGVLLILQPSGAALTLPALIAVAGSVLFALIMVITRKLRSADGTALIVWQTIGVMLAGAVTVPFAWTPPDALDFVLLASLGFAATAAHMCVNRSLRLAPASVVVPFQYTMIVWAMLFGFLVFGDVPDATILAGAALIVGSGLYVFHREQARPEKQPASASDPQPFSADSPSTGASPQG